MHGPQHPILLKVTKATEQTMKIMDSTYKGASGTIFVSRNATTGIDFSTNSSALASTGPNGGFYAIPTVKNSEGNFVAAYTAATNPEN